MRGEVSQNVCDYSVKRKSKIKAKVMVTKAAEGYMKKVNLSIPFTSHIA